MITHLHSLTASSGAQDAQQTGPASCLRSSPDRRGRAAKRSNSALEVLDSPSLCSEAFCCSKCHVQYI